MTNPIPLHRPINWQRLRSDEAQQVVRERASKTENVFFSEHAFDRIAEREIIQEDAYWILQTGSVDGKRWPRPFGQIGGSVKLSPGSYYAAKGMAAAVSGACPGDGCGAT